MFDFIQNTASPVFAAFLLGLLFSFDACPMLTNIAAIGYISRDLTDKKRLILRSLYFILGRIVALGGLNFSLAMLLKSGSKFFNFGQFFLNYSEAILIPLLFIFGFLLIFSDKISFLKIMFSVEKFEKNAKNDNFGAFLFGAILSLAFCPTNAVLFFGILMPLSVSVSYGYFALPLVFSLTTALPVILIAWVMAFSIKNIDKFYKIADKYSKIVIKAVGIILIFTGIYMLVKHIFLH